MLVRSLSEWKAGGGSIAEFARNQGIPRTTVLGWSRPKKGGVGRPQQLPPFNETAILRTLVESSGMQDWRSVRELVSQQSGDRLSRRSVFRYLRRWGLGDATRELPATDLVVVVREWEQPAKTLHAKATPLTGILWCVLSARGCEGFSLTGIDLGRSPERVAKALHEKFKGTRRTLRTDHPDLERLLESKSTTRKSATSA